MEGYTIKKANLELLIGKQANILSPTLRNKSDICHQDLLFNKKRDCRPTFECEDLKKIIDKIYKLSNAGVASGYVS
jgi:hypothetical protein